MDVQSFCLKIVGIMKVYDFLTPLPPFGGFLVFNL